MNSLNIAFCCWIALLVYASKVSKKKFGFWANHYFLTNIYWAICLFISIYHNYYVHSVTNEIYYIFFIGSVFFNSTLFISKIDPIPDKFPTYTFSLKRRRLLELVVFLTIAPLAYSNLKLILAGGEMWMMYEEYWDARASNSYIVEFFKQNAITPIAFVLAATCMYANYNNMGKHTKLLNVLIAASLGVLNMLMTAGGRTGLMQFMFFLFLSYLASKRVQCSSFLYHLNSAA